MVNSHLYSILNVLFRQQLIKPLHILNDSSLLGKANEVLVVGVHICKLDLNKKYQLFLRDLLTFSHTSVDNSLRLLPQQRKTSHLHTTQHPQPLTSRK